MAKPDLIYTLGAASARAEESQRLVESVAEIARDPYQQYYGLQDFGRFDRIALAHESSVASIDRGLYAENLKIQLDTPLQIPFGNGNPETQKGLDAWLRSLPLGTVLDLKVGPARAYAALVSLNSEGSTRQYHENLGILIAADIRSASNPSQRATAVTDVGDIKVHPDVSPATYNSQNSELASLWRTDNFNQAMGGAFGDWLTAFGPVGEHRFSDRNHMPTGLEQVANIAVQGHTFGQQFLTDISGQRLTQGALLHLGHHLESWERFQQALHAKSRPFQDLRTDLSTQDARYTIQRPITALALPANLAELGNSWSFILRPGDLDQDGNPIANIGPTSAIWQYNTRTLGLGAAGMGATEMIDGLMQATQVDLTRQLF